MVNVKSIILFFPLTFSAASFAADQAPCSKSQINNGIAFLDNAQDVGDPSSETVFELSDSGSDALKGARIEYLKRLEQLVRQYENEYKSTGHDYAATTALSYKNHLNWLKENSRKVLLQDLLMLQELSSTSRGFASKNERESPKYRILRKESLVEIWPIQSFNGDDPQFLTQTPIFSVPSSLVDDDFVARAQKKRRFLAEFEVIGHPRDRNAVSVKMGNPDFSASQESNEERAVRCQKLSPVRLLQSVLDITCENRIRDLKKASQQLLPESTLPGGSGELPPSLEGRAKNP